MKTTNIDKLGWMAIIVMIGMLLFYSCSTQKHASPCTTCPSYTTIKIPYNDTIYFAEVHEHICLGDTNFCFYIEASSFPYTDTIYFYDI